MAVFVIVDYHNNWLSLRNDYDECKNIEVVDYVADLYVNPSKFKLENNSDYSLLEDDSTAFEYWILKKIIIWIMH